MTGLCATDKGSRNNENRRGEKIPDASTDSAQAAECKKRDIKLDVDIIQELHSLKQSQTVEMYQKTFEKTREALIALNYEFTEEDFISSFLSGLKEEIRGLVLDAKPKTLDDAFGLAQTAEVDVEFKMETLSSPSKTRITQDKEETSPYDTSDCYCTYGHPLRFYGLIGERAFRISCHNGIECTLLDTKVAILVGCKIEETEPLLVNFVHGGYKALSRFKSRIQWTTQGHEFEADVRIVNLGAMDMVLGTRWLRDHRFRIDVVAGNSAELVEEGKRVVLQIPEQNTNEVVPPLIIHVIPQMQAIPLGFRGY
ncbi:OLC1v1000370C1 [Oldenlandia corymbosa var. corymbosa]|uniref:OLC1v1000370C1 n=1 Tax=Oldenlandia corymbosa var. corymbosa TaxID=529605 RepID=A0AAV1D5G9_OLDCO|nr:OLC1v1000370C1 [Oldenlandia corymbosa var. corymbosa]